jgi:hypothetical protein
VERKVNALDHKLEGQCAIIGHWAFLIISV